MSGEGHLPTVPDGLLHGVTRGLPDVIAHLEQRRDNAATIAARCAETDELGELARDRRRQLDIQIDEFRAGLHIGSAEVRAEIARHAKEFNDGEG